jgi:hypothetical protein
MNGLSITGDIFGFVGACFIIAKIRFHRRIARPAVRKFRTHSEPGQVDKEATDDFLDLMAFILISAAFVFQICAQFITLPDWISAVVVNLPAAISLVILADRTEILIYNSTRHPAVQFLVPAHVDQGRSLAVPSTPSELHIIRTLVSTKGGADLATSRRAFIASTTSALNC